MNTYAKTETCALCGLTWPAERTATTKVNGVDRQVCSDRNACDPSRGYPLPPPPPPPSEHQPGLVPPEHVETNKRALEEKERLRLKDEEHRRRRLGIEPMDGAMKLAPWVQKEPVLA